LAKVDYDLGFEQGMERGVEQGVQQGVEQGRRKELQALVLDLLESRGFLLNAAQRARVEGETDVERLRIRGSRGATADCADAVFED